MVLCDTEIRAALESRQIVIDPVPPPHHIGTTALDLQLAKGFMRWKGHPPGVDFSINPAHPDFDYNKIATDYQEPSPSDKGDGSIVLEPGKMVLALTVERVELPRASRIAARVEGRSTLARLGIGVHVTAPTIHAGYRGRITLEITNQGEIPVRLCPGLRICQLIFEAVSGTPGADLKSVFQDQESVAGRPKPNA